jgi:ABC-type dipeptide/oligopeptide/nickel transport system permease component
MRLLRYALRRLLLVVPVLAAALFLTFALTRIVPGNPIDRVAGPYVSNEQRAAMKHAAYLDRPFYTQFALYVRDLANGKMGVSYTTAQDVSKDLRQRFPASFELVTYAMLIAVLIAVPLGIAAAIRKDSWIDHVARVVSVLGVSMPIFWLGLILLYVFFFKYGWFPGPLGRTGSATSDFDDITGILTIDTLIRGDFAMFREVVKALVLPCVTLGFVVMAPIARFTRATMAEVLESDYVRTARSLGLPFRVVVFQLALKNALIGILTIIAAVYGYALGGEVLVEIIFNWPGLGLYSYNAILSSDFPAIQGFVLLVTLIYMVIYLILDLLTAAIDPRVKF